MSDQASVTPNQSFQARAPAPRQTKAREIQGPIAVAGGDRKFAVSGPSLVRWDRWSDDSAAIDAIRVTYDAGVGAIDESMAVVSIGNYCYLPVAGTYLFHNVATTAGSVTLTGTLYENIDPVHALMYVTSILPAFTDITRLVTIGAASSGQLDNFAIGGKHYRHRICAAIISNTGGGDLLVAFGTTPTATLGHPIAAGQTLIVPPGILSAISITGFSTAGTTVSVTYSYR